MFQLFDYQQDLVDKARNALAAGNQGVLIVSPPGSGKSVVISEIAKLTVKKRWPCIILCPSPRTSKADQRFF